MSCTCGEMKGQSSREYIMQHAASVGHVTIDHSVSIYSNENYGHTFQPKHFASKNTHLMHLTPRYHLFSRLLHFFSLLQTLILSSFHPKHNQIIPPFTPPSIHNYLYISPPHHRNSTQPINHYTVLSRILNNNLPNLT